MDLLDLPDDVEREEMIAIIERPMYRVIVYIEGDDVDVDIALTAKGKRYARGRARGFHRRAESEEDMLAEIIAARDGYYPQAQRPDRKMEARFDNAMAGMSRMPE